MKKIIVTLMAGAVLCSCSSNVTPSKEYLSYNISNDNYETFFRVEKNDTYKKINIEPRFNKHLDYKNVVFTFKSTRYSETNYGVSTLPRSSVVETHTFSINIDSTGSGSNPFFKAGSEYPSGYYDVDFISAEGNVSFKEDYSTFKKIEDLNRDINHRENVGVYYNLSGGTTYVLRFKADLNFANTADTDAFYIIESVKVRFTATINNSTKECEYEFKPDFFGVAEIPTNDSFTGTFSNLSYKYTNGYYLAY